MWLSGRTCAGENLPNSGGRSESSGTGRPFFHGVASTDGHAHDSYPNRPSRGMPKVCPSVVTASGSCRLAALHDLEMLNYQDLECAWRFVTAKAPSKEAQRLAGPFPERGRQGPVSPGKCGRR